MYKCECGRTFNDPQGFNGHKAHCKEHYIARDGNLDALNSLHARQRQTFAATVKRNQELAASIKDELLNIWISEQHLCDRCGKIMTEKYGSGRFCSKFCANSHPRTAESRLKTSLSMKKIGPRGAVLKSHLYHTNNHTATKTDKNKVCQVCGKELLQERIGYKTCSHECKKLLLSRHAKDRNFGGPSSVSSFGKRGSYKGIHCDSTYELAFLIYCLDHNIAVERNQRNFSYVLNNKNRNYYPDFYLPDHNVFIEIKGRDIGPVYEKLQAVLESGCSIKILHYKDLQACFDYVCKTYNVYHSLSSSNIHSLYDT